MNVRLPRETVRGFPSDVRGTSDTVPHAGVLGPIRVPSPSWTDEGTLIIATPASSRRPVGGLVPTSPASSGALPAFTPSPARASWAPHGPSSFLFVAGIALALVAVGVIAGLALR